MIHWTVVPMRVHPAGEIAAGAEVPGRVACLEMLRRDGRCEGVELGAPVASIDWTGFEAGVAGLDAHSPQVVLVPVPRGEA